MDGEARVRKLRFMCRRGMKELDLLLENFLVRHDRALRNGEWARLEAFLAEEDDRIWDWIQSAHSPAADGYQSLIDALRGRT